MHRKPLRMANKRLLSVLKFIKKVANISTRKGAFLLRKNCILASWFTTFVTDKIVLRGGDMYIKYNPNPTGRNVGDCAVRAIAKALKVDWETAYSMIVENGYYMGDMPSADSVWGAVLRQNGFYRKAISNMCPDCYTAEDFALDNPKGTYVLGFGGHVATIVNGNLYDSWDSSQEIPVYVWYRKDE